MSSTPIGRVTLKGQFRLFLDNRKMECCILRYFYRRT